MIGEFTAYNEGTYIISLGVPKQLVIEGCLLENEILKYSGNGKKDVTAISITDLVVYDKPKELKEFYTECQMNCEYCDMWGLTRVNADEFDMDCTSDWFKHKPLTRPPQSWCYVEEVEG